MPAAAAPPSAQPAVKGERPAIDPRRSISEEHKVQALTEFALAEASLSRNDVSAAEGHAARAVAGDPKRAEYVALHAWTRALSGVASDLPEAIKTLSGILEEDPCDERALYYRGKLLQRSGKPKAALRDFVTILYTNPTHKEALTEVRILRMRKGK